MCKTSHCFHFWTCFLVSPLIILVSKTKSSVKKWPLLLTSVEHQYHGNYVNIQYVGETVRMQPLWLNGEIQCQEYKVLLQLGLIVHSLFRVLCLLPFEHTHKKRVLRTLWSFRFLFFYYLRIKQARRKDFGGRSTLPKEGSFLLRPRSFLKEQQTESRSGFSLEEEAKL